MPNHCQNQLTITGKQAELNQFRRQAAAVWPWRGVDDPDDNVIDLNPYAFLPAPPTAIINGDGTAICGYNNAHLGTKWGAYDCAVENGRRRLEYTFVTAWAPFFDGVIEAMSAAFPELLFDYRWDESGEGFEGMLQCRRGEVVDRWQHDGDAYEGILNGLPNDEEGA